MTSADPIYGPYTISSPVVACLLQSSTLRRLGGVMQHGITALLGLTQPITRLQHSIGTMLLVSRLGGSLEEQIAALLHDVSHPAFSHVIDFVFGDPHFHDRKKEWYLERSEIPALLAEHGFDWCHFLDDTTFPLLEQPAPRLCADRLDYFLRDSSALGILSTEQVQLILSGLIVREGRIGMSDREAARLAGLKYLEADAASWSNPQEALLYELTARAIRGGLAAGVLHEEDLWGVDADLWRKLREARNGEVARLAEMLVRGPSFEIVEEGEIRVRPKVRTIDPEVWTTEGLRPLSTLDADFARRREDYVKSKTNGFGFRLRS